MKVRDVLKRLKEEGWSVHNIEGDHRQLKNPNRPGKVTVAGHPSDEVPPKTLKRIWDQAGIEE